MDTLPFPLLLDHPERFSWYLALIEEWTGQTPTFLEYDQGIVVSVQPYVSASGIAHSVPTCALGTTHEEALEELACYVYEDVEADRLSVSLAVVI